MSAKEHISNYWGTVIFYSLALSQPFQLVVHCLHTGPALTSCLPGFPLYQEGGEVGVEEIPDWQEHCLPTLPCPWLHSVTKSQFVRTGKLGFCKLWHSFSLFCFGINSRKKMYMIFLYRQFKKYQICYKKNCNETDSISFRFWVWSHTEISI